MNQGNQPEEIIYNCGQCGAPKVLKLSDERPLNLDDVQCDKCKTTILFKEKCPIQDVVDCR